VASSTERRAKESYKQARQAADRVLDRTALRPALKRYEQAVSGVSHSMRQAFTGSLREPADAHQVARVLGHLTRRLNRVSGDLGAFMAGGTRVILTEAHRNTAETLARVRGGPSPLDRPEVTARIVHMQGPELHRLRMQSTRGTVASIHDVMRRELRKAAFEEELTVGDLLARADEVLVNNAWRMERLVRTEASYAYNLAQTEAIAELAEQPEFRGVMPRWTELVSDLTWKPLDARVGKDSIEMHAQVTRPGGLFHAPSGWRVPGDWTQPPNRPHDRAVLMPWMRGWGIPAWMWQAGRRVDLGS
jgi:hypothetical protein